MEISAEARKIEASHGGSITKKRMTPEIRATTLAMAAKTMLTVRSWAIVRIAGAAPSPTGRDAAALLSREITGEVRRPEVLN